MELEKQQNINRLAKEYSLANDELAKVKNLLVADVESIRAKYRDQLKAAADNIISATKRLESAIVESPEIFVNTKTQTVSGIKLGFRKATDELVFKIDEDTTIELIKESLPRKKKLLIKTEEKLVKTALKNLSNEELKLIECTLEINDDVVFIKSADDVIDKFIKQLTAE